VDNLWAKVLPVVLQVAPQTFLLVHPVHLAARLLLQKHQLFLVLYPGAKLQVENGQAAQLVLRLLLATQTLCEHHHHQAQLLV